MSHNHANSSRSVTPGSELEWLVQSGANLLTAATNSLTSWRCCSSVSWLMGDTPRADYRCEISVVKAQLNSEFGDQRALRWLQEKRQSCEHCKATSEFIHMSDCFCPLPQHSYGVPSISLQNQLEGPSALLLLLLLSVDLALAEPA